ncbi:hypothetical protein GCM10009665_34490 [Kitasatospora nipponensis]|uniref:Uncharacterized protein n=1 Tax=Kitasatospora nipponensis TaxID=258049 RepID=A0ABN1W932_9ACTN
MPGTPTGRRSNDALTELAERVEKLCREYGRNDQLADLLTAAGADDLLRQVIELMASGDRPLDRMTDLLDRLDAAATPCGLHGLTRPDRTWSPLPGVRTPREAPPLRVCPVRWCTRAEESAAGCALVNRPLTLLP